MNSIPPSSPAVASIGDAVQRHLQTPHPIISHRRISTGGRSAVLAIAAVLAAGCTGCKSDQSSPGTSPPQTEPGQPAASTARPAAPSGSPTPLREGAAAPDFTATAHDGSEIELSALRGHPVVVFFYQKDGSAACTAQAEGFRDDFGKFKQHQVTIIGISLDSNESHRQFADKHKLPFALIADDGTIASQFGVPIENGRAQRMTFVIDAEGKIDEIFSSMVNPGRNARTVLDLIEEMKM